MIRKVAIIGGRGYAGGEFLGLLAGHPGLSLTLAASGSQAGMPIREAVPAWPDDGTCFSSLAPEQAAEIDADAWLLALPNGLAADWVQAITRLGGNPVMVDFGADFRFDEHWCYGLPELDRAPIHSARRIANPGCYATAGQLGLAPLARIGGGLDGTPALFGVSGYSGAGRTPGPRNDPERLRDNLLPYSLAGHLHEREISHRLGFDVRFMPHVAAFFRGISMTIHAQLKEAVDVDTLNRHIATFYADEPLVQVVADIPEIREVQGTALTRIGGVTVDDRDPRRISLVVVLDNLLKGAASQAMQNLNLALGLAELEGLASVSGPHAKGEDDD